MRKDMAIKLNEAAEKVAEMFSRKDRGGNYIGETFSVGSIVILSETTALVTFEKEPTKKRAAAWFYFINSQRSPRWEYFFMTYSHLVGLERAKSILHEIEQHNFRAALEQKDE